MATSTTPLTVLPISAFNDARIFASPHASDRTGAARTFDLQLWGMSFACRYEADIQTLFVSCGAGEYAIIIEEVFGRQFFLCDCCVQRRIALVLDSGELLCREVYREQGSSGSSMAIRSARFTMAVEELMRERPVARLRGPEAAKKASSYALRDEPEIDPRLAAEARMSTTKAIDLGRGAGQYPHYDEYLQTDREYWRKIETAPLYQRPGNSSLTDAHPKLDINEFRPRLITYKDEVNAKTLCWGERAEQHQEVLFFVDWRDELPLIIVAHDFNRDSTIRWQRLPLVQQPSGRFRWKCPVRDKNCDILYLRNGLFASREAQWIYSPSQRAAGRKRTRINKCTGD